MKFFSISISIYLFLSILSSCSEPKKGRKGRLVDETSLKDLNQVKNIFDESIVTEESLAFMEKCFASGATVYVPKENPLIQGICLKSLSSIVDKETCAKTKTNPASTERYFSEKSKSCYKSLEDIVSEEDCLELDGIFIPNFKNEERASCFANINKLPKDLCTNLEYFWYEEKETCLADKAAATGDGNDENSEGKTPSQDINCSDGEVYSWAKNYCVSPSAVSAIKIPTFSGEVLDFSSHPDLVETDTGKVVFVTGNTGGGRYKVVQSTKLTHSYAYPIDKRYHALGDYNGDGIIDILVACDKVTENGDELPDDTPEDFKSSLYPYYSASRKICLLYREQLNSSIIFQPIDTYEKKGKYTSNPATEIFDIYHKTHFYSNFNLPNTSTNIISNYESQGNGASNFAISVSQDMKSITRAYFDLNLDSGAHDWMKTWYGNFDGNGLSHMILSGNNAYMSFSDEEYSFTYKTWNLTSSSEFNKDNTIVNIDNTAYTWAHDVNGNGRTDLISITGDPSTTHTTIKVFTNNGNKDPQTLKTVFDYKSCEGGPWGPSDFVFIGNFAGHSDGRLDIVSFHDNVAYFKLNDDAGCFIPFVLNLELGNWGGAKNSFQGDFNGDGLQDIITLSSSSKFTLHLAKTRDDHGVEFASYEVSLPAEIPSELVGHGLLLPDRKGSYRDPGLNFFGNANSVDFYNRGMNDIIFLNKVGKIHILKPNLAP